MFYSHIKTMSLVLPAGTLYSLEDFDDDYEYGIDKTKF